MRRVSRVSNEPPPNSTATSNSSRIAAKFLEVEDMAPSCGAAYRLGVVVRRIVIRPTPWPASSSYSRPYRFWCLALIHWCRIEFVCLKRQQVPVDLREWRWEHDHSTRVGGHLSGGIVQPR